MWVWFESLFDSAVLPLPLLVDLSFLVLLKGLLVDVMFAIEQTKTNIIQLGMATYFRFRLLFTETGNQNL